MDKSFSDVFGELMLEKIQRRRSEGKDVADDLAKYAEWERQRAAVGEHHKGQKQ